MAPKRVCRKEMPKMEKLASRIFQSSRKVSESWRVVEHQTHKRSGCSDCRALSSGAQFWGLGQGWGGGAGGEAAIISFS